VGNLGLMTLLMALLLWGSPAWAFEPPAFQGDVLDEAGVLDPSDEALLVTRIDQLRDEAGIWAAVYLARGLDGESLEQAANLTFRRWELGQAGKDNGLLVMIVPSDRQMRIEVGYGLEGVLTDAFCRQIIEQIYKPAFRDGRFAAGIIQGFQLMAQEKQGDGAVACESGVQEAAPSLEPDWSHAWSRFVTVLLVDLFPALLFAAAVAYGRRQGRINRGEAQIAPLAIFLFLGLFFGIFVAVFGAAFPDDPEVVWGLWGANGLFISLFGIPLLLQSRRYVSDVAYQRFLARERLLRIRRRSGAARQIFGQWFDPAVVSSTLGGSRAESSDTSDSGSSSSDGSDSSSGGGSSGGGGASGSW
jgi:uncharacterized protein